MQYPMPANKETEMADPANMTFNLLALFALTPVLSGVAVVVSLWISDWRSNRF